MPRPAYRCRSHHAARPACRLGPRHGRVQAPLLEGQQQVYPACQLRPFQQRHRDNFPMSTIVSGMSDAGLDDLAARLARQPWPAHQRPVDAKAVEHGRRLADRAGCSRCHGPDLTGGPDGPRLAGQHPGYLERQLAALLDQRRTHPAGDDSQPRLPESSAHELSSLSHYVHAAGRPARR